MQLARRSSRGTGAVRPSGRLLAPLARARYTLSRKGSVLAQLSREESEATCTLKTGPKDLQKAHHLEWRERAGAQARRRRAVLPLSNIPALGASSEKRALGLQGPGRSLEPCGPPSFAGKLLKALREPRWRLTALAAATPTATVPAWRRGEDLALAQAKVAAGSFPSLGAAQLTVPLLGVQAGLTSDPAHQLPFPSLCLQGWRDAFPLGGPTPPPALSCMHQGQAAAVNSETGELVTGYPDSVGITSLPVPPSQQTHPAPFCRWEL